MHTITAVESNDIVIVNTFKFGNVLPTFYSYGSGR